MAIDGGRAGTGNIFGEHGFPLPHATSHEDGGSDEIEVTGLSGKLADPQSTDLKSEGYELVYFWLGVEGG